MKNILEWACRCSLAVCCSLLPLAAPACSNPPRPAETEGPSGTVEIALTAQGQSGTTYLLRRATLDLTGPETRQLDLNGQTALVRVELTPGTYSAQLRTGWEIARQLADGTFEPIYAVLQTPQPQSLEVIEGSVTDLPLAFDVGEGAVSFGNGRVDVSVNVNEVDGATCGNGVVEGSEQCDDGNLVDADACRNTCVAAMCSDGIVQAITGEQCDDAGPSATCSATCTLLTPPVPEDLPDTPLVYVGLGTASVSGPDLAGVPAGAPAILVLGVYPIRACEFNDCGYDLTAAPGPVVEGYVRVGTLTYPVPADVVASMTVRNGGDIFLTDGFAISADWTQTGPAPAIHSLQVNGSERNNGAGLLSAAMPRDLTSFEQLDWFFTIETLQGSNRITSNHTEWVVIDSGATCGDAVVAPGVETCDDGNVLDGDGCSATCRWELAAPSVSGVAYSIYGHAQYPFRRAGTPMLLTARVDLQPTCPNQGCSYTTDDLAIRIDTTLLTEATGNLIVNASPFFQNITLFGASSSLGARLGGVDPAPLDTALPTAPIDLTRFGSERSLRFDGSQQGTIVSWHSTLVDCSGGTCACTPATCPASAFCGVFPDGCGGYLDCGCAGGAACTDGTCPTP
ncbi:DUF4215 domain-containing protein [Sorangium sp. So ce281]|uniref:DUF4215 domain-containing protein n=1 Tax=unclassified Sorangium TaxID=2621164 RepID=UPI003F6091BC